MPKTGEWPQATSTQGTYQSSKYFMGSNIFFLDFCKSRRIPKIKMRLFDSPLSRYDVIVGHGVLRCGFVLDHARHTVTWDGLTIEMATSKPKLSTSTTCFSYALSSAQIYANSTSKIMRAKYTCCTRSNHAV